MKKMSIVCGAALLAMAATACKKSDDKKAADKPVEVKADPAPAPAAPAAAPAAPVAAAPAKVKTCADYGGTGKGDFSDSCELKGNSPFDVVVTGEFKEDGDKPRSVLKITNKFDHDVNWAGISVWYYDKDGNLLPLKRDDGTDLGKSTYMNGSGVITAKPGETVEVLAGVDKARVPAATAKIEAEVYAWGWDGDGNDANAMYFAPHADIENHDDDTRPMGGWVAGAAAGSAEPAAGSGSGSATP